MKPFLSVLLLFLYTTVFSQDTLVFPVPMNNVKTPQHIHIKNTRFFIIPPPGFEVIDSAFMIRKTDREYIWIQNITGYDYRTVTPDFTRKYYSTRHKETLLSFQEFTINGHPARSAFRQVDTVFKIIDMVFGDSTFLGRVNAVFPLNSTAEQDILNSLGSIVYDDKIPIPPFAITSFELDSKTSLFRLAKVTSMMMLYSLNGVVKKSYADQPHLWVRFEPPYDSDDEMSLRHAMGEAFDGFYKGIKTDYRQQKISKEKVNGFSSHEGEVPGKLNGKDVFVYIHTVKVGRQVAVMHGICFKKEHLAEFKKLTHTIRRKTWK